MTQRQRQTCLLFICACGVTSAFMGSQRHWRRSPLVIAASPDCQWEECAGCKLLRPEGEPRAVVHFLGGAFVSPQPTVAYRYVLESLTKRGYVIVATPFAVDFDYRIPATSIREKYAAASDAIMEDYGMLPRLAMGHSLGALMHVLLACLYPEAHAEGTDGVALISYNNKPVEGAIPAFKEIFVPALAPLEPLSREPAYDEFLAQSKELRRAGFGLAREVANGVAGVLNLAPGESLIPGVDPIILKAIDDAEAAAELVDQIPGVIASISQGASEFEPTPGEMRELVSSSYTQRSPLLVSFTDDGIDESEVLAAILPAGLSPRRSELPGTHITPLAIDPNAPSTPLLPIPEVFGPDLRAGLLREADALVDTLDDYFTAVIVSSESTPENSGLNAEHTEGSEETQAASVKEATSEPEPVAEKAEEPIAGVRETTPEAVAVAETITLTAAQLAAYGEPAVRQITQSVPTQIATITLTAAQLAAYGEPAQRFSSGVGSD